jgi:hypothetical protein
MLRARMSREERAKPLAGLLFLSYGINDLTTVLGIVRAGPFRSLQS